MFSLSSQELREFNYRFHEMEGEVAEELEKKAAELTLENPFSEMDAFLKSNELIDQGLQNLQTRIKIAYPAKEYSLPIKLLLSEARLSFHSPCRLQGRIEKIMGGNMQ